MSSINFQNPPGIIDGPRKRQPSKRVTENGDHHTNKKAKTTEAIKILPKVSTVSNNSRRASVQDIPEPVTASYPQPRLADHVLEAADGSDDDHLIGMPSYPQPHLADCVLEAADSGDDDDLIGMPGLEDIEDDDDDSDDDDDPEDDEAELSMFCSLPLSSAF
jgi:hypothetical protein